MSEMPNQTLPPPGTPPPRRSRRKDDSESALFTEDASSTPAIPSAVTSDPASSPGLVSNPSTPLLGELILPDAAQKTLACVTLTLPLAEPPDTQVHRINAWHVDCQFRDAETRNAFRQFQAGLDVSGVRLADGRRVVSGADAIRWLVQQIAAALATAEK